MRRLLASKRLTVVLIATAFLCALLFTPLRAEAAGAQELYNVVIFVDFADSVDNFMNKEDRSAAILSSYGDTTKLNSMIGYIFGISNGKLSVKNIYPTLSNGLFTCVRLSKNRVAYETSQGNTLGEFELVREAIGLAALGIAT